MNKMTIFLVTAPGVRVVVMARRKKTAKALAAKRAILLPPVRCNIIIATERCNERVLAVDVQSNSLAI